MKTLFFTLLLAFVVLNATAQNCEEALYKDYLKKAEAFFKQKNYLESVNMYSSALAVCPKEAAFVKQKLRDVFVEINQLKEKTESAERTVTNAQEETEYVIKLFDKTAEDIHRKYKNLLNVQDSLNTDRLKRRDSLINDCWDMLRYYEKHRKLIELNQKKVDRFISAFDFVYDRFALAFNYDFYFIDKDGNKVEKLGRWDKVEQFNWYDFAKVKKENNDKKLVDYLLDTLGNSYLVAYQIENLNPDVKALDLTSQQISYFPEQILTHTQLEVLILNQNTIKKIPTTINLLQNLKRLQIEQCYLEHLPEQIGELKNLTHLNLWHSNLIQLPTQIGNLKNLTMLYLGSTNLRSLPVEIGELENLTYLSLNWNNLKTLPAEIGKLKNLIYLGLSENNLKTLPVEIGELKNLKYLDISENHFSEEEQEKIRKLLPNCEVVF